MRLKIENEIENRKKLMNVIKISGLRQVMYKTIHFGSLQIKSFS